MRETGGGDLGDMELVGGFFLNPACWMIPAVLGGVFLVGKEQQQQLNRLYVCMCGKRGRMCGCDLCIYPGGRGIQQQVGTYVGIRYVVLRATHDSENCDWRSGGERTNERTHTQNRSGRARPGSVDGWMDVVVVDRHPQSPMKLISIGQRGEFSLSPLSLPLSLSFSLSFPSFLYLFFKNAPSFVSQSSIVLRSSPSPRSFSRLLVLCKAGRRSLGVSLPYRADTDVVRTRKKEKTPPSFVEICI